MRTRAQIETDIVRSLRSLKAAEKSRRTPLFRDIAEGLVDLREHFITPEGRPDWIGRTGAYRLAVRDLFSRAGYQSRDEAQAVQKAVQYHIGNIVRERISRTEREDIGLGEVSPREAAARTRARRSELVEMARKMQAEQAAGKGRRR